MLLRAVDIVITKRTRRDGTLVSAFERHRWLIYQALVNILEVDLAQLAQIFPIPGT